MRVPQVSERIKEVPAQALRGVFAGIGQLLLITDKLRNKTPADAGVPRARTPERSEPVADATVSEPAVPPEKATELAPAQPAAAKSSSVKSAPAKPDTAKAAAAKAAAAKPARTEAPKAPKTLRTRDFDKTGNVRLLDDAETAAAAPVSPPAVRPAPAAVRPAPAPAPPAEAPATPAAEAAAAAAPADAAPADAETAAPATPAAAGSELGDSSPPLPNYDELSVASLRARLRNLDVVQVRQLAEYERAHAARADVIAMFERRIAKLEADA
jgi:hypothetical protein